VNHAHLLFGALVLQVRGTKTKTEFKTTDAHTGIKNAANILIISAGGPAYLLPGVSDLLLTAISLPTISVLLTEETADTDLSSKERLTHVGWRRSDSGRITGLAAGDTAAAPLVADIVWTTKLVVEAGRLTGETQTLTAHFIKLDVGLGSRW
jgi:hypothetical protein